MNKKRYKKAVIFTQYELLMVEAIIDEIERQGTIINSDDVIKIALEYSYKNQFAHLPEIKDLGY